MGTTRAECERNENHHNKLENFAVAQGNLPDALPKYQLRKHPLGPLNRVTFQQAFKRNLVRSGIAGKVLGKIKLLHIFTILIHFKDYIWIV